MFVFVILMFRGNEDQLNTLIENYSVFPKKNVSHVSENEVFEVIELINNRPLKILNGNTAISTFGKYVNGCSD